MQPTLPQGTGAAATDMDLPAVQSMDWLFKKERIYLLAQFWQQRATIAEKEVNTLKEQLSMNPAATATTGTAVKTSSASSNRSSPTPMVNGISLPSPSTTPLSDSSVTNLNNKLINNNKVVDEEDSDDEKMDTTKDSGADEDAREAETDSRLDGVSRKSPATDASESGEKVTNNNVDKTRDMKSLLEELAAKDKEIKALAEEVARLRAAIATIQETHNAQMQRLEERLEAKRQHISNLETRIEKQNDYDEVIKKESSILRSVDLSTTSDHKQFQELLLERTKALAAQQQQHQSEAIKSSNSDGAPPSRLHTSAHTQSSGRSATSPAANRPASTPNNNAHFNSNSFLPPPLHNVETFGSILGEEIVSSWRRNLELPPPPTLAAVKHLMNSHASAVLNNNNNNSTDPNADEKQSRHSSTASTPVPPDVSRDESFNGRGSHTPSSLPAISKSPAEDNNNTLGMPHVPPGFPLSFPFQDRAPIRFAEDLHLPPGAMVGRLGDSLIPKGDPMEARLQEMLRYNMDKYANQNLDTLHISRRVRELLSVHNIGQRLFAKYVLGLSQGTVSELLSKPKPWDKLTEKGRDSYRKMHAWACDNEAILLLKSLIPKKGSEPGMPQFGRPEGEMNDERLQHILTEASSMISKNQPHHHLDDSRSMDDSKSPDHCLSPFSKDHQQMKNKMMGNESEKMARMYHEELAKLMNRSPREAFPGGGMPPMPDENIRMALEAYHREFAKLQQSGAGNIPSFPNIPNLPSLLALQQQALNGVQDLTISKEKQHKMNGQNEDSASNREVEEAMSKQSSSAFSLVKPKSEPGSRTPTNTTTSSAAPSPLSNTILPPAGTEDFPSASPLQRMASITNSLITQPPTTPHHSSVQRPMKAVLPPITQQQFDMFNNLNTEDIVRRVKEALSQYSISQRLFGESVLGLSQGSVSDLLARPKPWHMLTQKGREPFIRMKMFLEDDNAVHKLVASQYKIAPEKLMRTGSYSGSPQIPAALSKQMPPMPKSISEQMSKLQDQQQALLHMQIAQSQLQPHIPTSQPNHSPPMLLTPPGMPPHLHHLQQAVQQEKKPMPISLQSPQHNNAMRNMNSHISPTVYEMAALTQDLDTQVITTKIKEALLANNIGQKIFGEAVLGLSQGSVSELLSKPKPWHMLSIKGREPFIRMQLWLSDANNVDRLQALKNERREASKRRRSTGPGAQDNSSDTSSNDTSEFYHSNSPGPGSVGSNSAPPSKKQRVLFSEEQKEALRLAFALDPYPNVQTIEFLANELGLSTRTITNWFHNHRMRLKQQVPHGAPSEPLPSRENTNNQPFDPVQFRILLNQRLMEIQKERIGLGGMTLPYPYFGANPNLAALISRGLLSNANEAELAALKNAVNEQMSGLDLSMPAVKREEDDFEEDENESRASDNESEGDKSEQKEAPIQNLSRTSRRKPAAPQWVNPDWQDDKKPSVPGAKEVIINGVCVMQKNDFGRDDEETVRVEPQEAHESDEHSDNESTQANRSSKDDDEEAGGDKEDAKEEFKVKKEKEEDDRWEY